ncbi:sulfate adenylyltransferase [Alginatibacterium sediminis]|uniref:Sulfate adenylyltransferase n=1 Tax=Alginatibacterium sediminis TaxID=2164068 RepID=A0A420E5N6_9ALTE|nr:sulfate adenylyltransferase [Alginatibacterium sediminis]
MALRPLLKVLACLCLLAPMLLVALEQDAQKLIALVRDNYGESAAQRVTQWQALLEQSKTESELTQLTLVNDFFNQMQWLEDQTVWGKNDYWATPSEFLGAGAGDCEDFSIAKYYSLRKLGVDDEKMRLIYVKALDYQQFHMVLAYYETPSSVPVILDNINPQILPATKRNDLAPVYSFNAQHLWLVKEQGRGELAGKSDRLKLWTELREGWQAQRMRQPILKQGTAQ